ncbi:MAG: ComF family protein [Planctomycetota bacterium]|jgi:ComF family protein
MIAWASVGQSMLDLLFPRVCPACESCDGLDRDGFCATCRAELEVNLAQNYCRRCANSVGPYAAADGACSQCRGWYWPIAGIARVGSYRGRLRELLVAYKYAGRDDLSRFFADLLFAELGKAAWFERVQALAAVPTCWDRRLRGKPYVATSLARDLGRVTVWPCLPLLQRIRGGPSQIGLSMTQRRKNVRGAFRVASGVRLDQAVVCLVDDVTTSGATLTECARMLRRAGAAEVYAAVACKSSSLKAA